MKNAITEAILLQRHGLEGKFLETVRDLHETTTYHVREKDGVRSDTRSGACRKDSRYPHFFNMHHQTVMRISESENNRTHIKKEYSKE